MIFLNMRLFPDSWFKLKFGRFNSFFTFHLSDLCCYAGLEGNGKPLNGTTERKQLSSVSTALLLAVGIGIFEAATLSLASGPFLNLMGVPSVSFISLVSCMAYFVNYASLSFHCECFCVLCFCFGIWILLFIGLLPNLCLEGFLLADL